METIIQKAKAITLMAGRIEDEYRKHANFDWKAIAAAKIYTEWFEYYTKEIERLQSELQSLREDRDTFALKFAEWKRINNIHWHISRERPIQLKHKAGWFFKGKHYDTSELLQIFKQEQQKTGNNG